MQTLCHLSVLIHEQAKKYGEKRVITYHEFGHEAWSTVSWNEFSLKVKAVSNALLNLGVKVQENIGIFSQNAAEYLYTDYGAWGIRAVTVPFYATSSEQQLAYIINDAAIRILFVGEQEQYDRAKKVFHLCPTLEKIIVFDKSVRISTHDPNTIYFTDFLQLADGLPRQIEVEEIARQAKEDDICNILYTSGTSGDSKGVILTEGQFLAAMKSNGECVPVHSKDRVITFLPISHVLERAWDMLVLTKGGELIVNTNPHDILKSLVETNPTCMAAVPRFWEKVYNKVQETIEKAPPMKRKIFKHALEIGRRYNLDYVRKCKRPPLSLALQYKMVDKLVLSLVRKQLGLTQPHIFPTAGAAVAPAIEVFVNSIGINMLVGYGLTESLATVTCDRLNTPTTIGSVGRPINGISIKFGENDEILLKGPTITKGYYKRQALNEQSFDKDGYFRTGDAGYMKDGELFLTERLKDLFKTSNGKYIAPQMIESTLMVDKYIDQVVVVANERKYVAALIVPEYRLLEEYAHDNGISFANREELCANKKINAMLAERIETLQQKLAGYEQVKKFTLLPHHLSMEKGELTNTLKVRRNVLNKNYAQEIEKMYEE